MPAAKSGSRSTVLLGDSLRADVRKLDTISVTGATKGFGTESKGNTSADAVCHLLGYHIGVDPAPVPLVLVGRSKPGDAVQDDGLDFDPGGAVLVPDTFNP